ncbi:MAG TPA: gamma-glutamyltransferase [Blastocatellia bacterium]|nr:gamma-glutamyltransferase [Blastocatellia bacterium]
MIDAVRRSRSLRIFVPCLLVLTLLMTTNTQSQDSSSRSKWPLSSRTGRSVVRSRNGMVASSQPLASQIGVEILKRGGNAVDAAIAMAAVLNVTEPMMTGIGGDAFALVYSAKTGEFRGLNASGRAPRALTRDYFAKKGMKTMPEEGMETVTVPGAFDGWVTLLEKYGTMKLADVLAPAIEYAENGFPVMEKAAKDWEYGSARFRSQAAIDNYLIGGRPPRAGELFTQRNLAKTLRVLARGGRDAFYKGEIGRAIADFCKKNGGFITVADLAEHHSDWVEPISTDYRGYKVCEIPPNGQGITALIALNILEGFDLSAMSSQPDLYYHTLIEATKLAFADRNRYIADPAFAKVPVQELLSKEYAAKRRGLIKPDSAIESPTPGEIGNNTTYLTVVDKDRNAVSFINSLYDIFGSGVVAGDTGIVLQNRASGFSLDPDHPNRLEPGKRPFHTIIPAMVFKDGRLFMSFGVMGGAVQAQGHVLVLSGMIDLGLGLQEAIELPRYRYVSGNSVLMEDAMTADVITRLIARGHRRATQTEPVNVMGGGQAIMIDPVTGALLGASDQRKDGMALGY